MKIAGLKAREGYDKLVSEKEKEIEKYALDNSDVILPYLRLQKELSELQSKRTNVMIKIAQDLYDNKHNTPF